MLSRDSGSRRAVGRSLQRCFDGDLVNSSPEFPGGNRWTARAARRYRLTAKAAHMCMHGKSRLFDVRPYPVPSFVGCLRATTAIERFPAGNATAAWRERTIGETRNASPATRNEDRVETRIVETVARCMLPVA